MSISANDPRLGDRDALARLLAEAARRAAAVLLVKRAAGEVQLKKDGSPVCAADLAADLEAKRALAELLPGIAVVSEESVTDETRVPDLFILLDPLDGTREFIAGGDSYCVAIAVVRDGRPLAGAIAAPALRRLWYAGENAFEQGLDDAVTTTGAAEPIHVRETPATGPKLLISRFHGDAVSTAIAAELPHGGCDGISSAVKFCLIACGEADLTVRGGPTMEWDIAAGEAILAAAGGAVLTFEGELPLYGRSERGFRNPPFVAASSAAVAASIAERAARLARG